MLDVEVISDVDVPDPAVVEQVLRFAFGEIDDRPQGKWELTVRLAAQGEVIRVHEAYFDDASDTDVMSFPSGEVARPSGPSPRYLGDVMISVSMATYQAHQVGHSLSREMAYLALHGLLHLLDYEDQSEEDQRAMLALQDHLLSAFEQHNGAIE